MDLGFGGDAHEKTEDKRTVTTVIDYESRPLRRTQNNKIERRKICYTLDPFQCPGTLLVSAVVWDLVSDG